MQVMGVVEQAAYDTLHRYALFVANKSPSEALPVSVAANPAARLAQCTDSTLTGADRAAQLRRTAGARRCGHRPAGRARRAAAAAGRAARCHPCDGAQVRPPAHTRPRDGGGPRSGAHAGTRGGAGESPQAAIPYRVRLRGQAHPPVRAPLPCPLPAPSAAPDPPRASARLGTWDEGKSFGDDEDEEDLDEEEEEEEGDLDPSKPWSREDMLRQVALQFGPILPPGQDSHQAPSVSVSSDEEGVSRRYGK